MDTNEVFFKERNHGKIVGQKEQLLKIESVEATSVASATLLVRKFKSFRCFLKKLLSCGRESERENKTIVEANTGCSLGGISWT